MVTTSGTASDERPDHRVEAVLVVADDLSGAAEAACLLAAGAPHAAPPVVRLGTPSGLGSVTGRAVTVIDTDTRHAPPGRAAETVRTAVAHRSPRQLVLKKTDSLLRGNLECELRVVAETGPVVFSPALPQLSRTVQAGRLYVEGVPLRETGLWAGESGEAPASVGEALEGMDAGFVGLADIRGPRPALLRRIGSLAEGHDIVVTDAESQDDVDAVVGAALAVGIDTLAGSASVARALSPHLKRREADSGDGVRMPADGTRHGLLVVIGTAAEAARRQVEHLRVRGASVVELSAARLLDQGPDIDLSGIGSEVVVVTLSPIEPDGIWTGVRLVDALARAVEPLTVDRDLVLAGGETARRVLDRIGIEQLTVVAEVEYGAVHSRAPGGRNIVTRPGSFGGIDSLGTISDYLRPGWSRATARRDRHDGSMEGRS